MDRKRKVYQYGEGGITGIPSAKNAAKYNPTEGIPVWGLGIPSEHKQQAVLPLPPKHKGTEVALIEGNGVEVGVREV